MLPKQRKWDHFPHRAFELPKVKEFITKKFNKFIDNLNSMEDILTEWDKVKNSIKNFAIYEWKAHTAKRGRVIT